MIDDDFIVEQGAYESGLSSAVVQTIHSTRSHVYDTSPIAGIYIKVHITYVTHKVILLIICVYYIKVKI